MPRNFMFYIIFIIGIVLDQGVKFFIRNNMQLGQSIEILGDFFKITYIENKGVAFSIGEENFILLYVLPIIFLTIGYYAWYKFKDNYGKLLTIGGAMVMAGGISNLIDRIMLKSVTDYFDLKNFAVFNIADILVDIGMVLVLICVFFQRKEKAIKSRSGV